MQRREAEADHFGAGDPPDLLLLDRRHRPVGVVEETGILEEGRRVEIGPGVPLGRQHAPPPVGDLVPDAEAVEVHVQGPPQAVAVTPDGKLAVSFLDSTTHYPSPTTGAEQTRPALAIEQTTTLTR